MSLEKSSIVLFDAHMVIDSDVGVVQIPFDVFYGLSPGKIIFLHDKPELILLRRAQDSFRNRPKRSNEEVREHQELSISLASNYASRMRIPFFLIENISENMASFEQAVLENSALYC